MQKHVTFTLDEGVAIVTMNSPPANAFTDELHDHFLEVLDALATQPVRAAIVTGTGRYFQAGGEMSRFLTLHTVEDAQQFVRRVQGFMDRLAGTPYPTIAAINGYALGGGLELALSCDLRIASTAARLGLPEARYGILPGAGGTQRLARLVGPGRAKWLMYTARQVSAEEAQALGLVERVAVPERLMDEALAWAREIVVNSPIAIRHIKRCVDEGLDVSLSEGLAIERDYWARLIPFGDYREGVQAWLEKRSPQFPDAPHDD
jgi:enoyl-CoA hydratase/carnithine racemase